MLYEMAIFMAGASFGMTIAALIVAIKLKKYKIVDM